MNEFKSGLMECYWFCPKRFFTNNKPTLQIVWYSKVSYMCVEIQCAHKRFLFLKFSRLKEIARRRPLELNSTFHLLIYLIVCRVVVVFRELRMTCFANGLNTIFSLEFWNYTISTQNKEKKTFFAWWNS